MNRRNFLKVSASCSLLMPMIGWSSQQATASGKELEEAAPERIQNNRRSALRIRVKDAQGKPVPGAKVAIEQRQHEFLFGCNFFMFGRAGDPELEHQYRSRFAALLNFATLGFYWANYEGTRGQPNYAYTEGVLKWTTEKAIRCKGHPLVWDHPAGSPRWLPEDDAEIDKLSRARVREIMARFKDKIPIWDVVNEATHLPDKANKTTMARWALKLGPAPYVEQHLREARAADPAATLIVNDYRTDPPYFRLLETLRTKDRTLFDVVGIQSHMHDGMWPVTKTWEICECYAKLELPLHFTETTLVSGPRKGPGENWGETTGELEARQAEDTARFYTLLFAHPAVQALTWWDFSDRGAWQRAASGWLRKDMSPKPAYERVMDLVKNKWWTRENGEVDASGKFASQAFRGSHTVSVTHNGRKVEAEARVTKKSKNELEITI